MERRLVYLSAAVGLPGRDVLDAILADSRAWNADHGITGLLMYHDGNFLQCLEGDRAAIDATFAKISRSRRHTRVMRLIDQPSTERLFGEWAMGFVPTLDGDQAKGFVDIRTAGREAMARDPVLATFVASYFESFRDLRAA
jgi:hypothetical protein